MKYSLFVSLFIFIFCANTHGLTPRRHNWIKLKTPHFTIITTDEYREFGKKAAIEAEKAFDSLTVLTDQFPKNTFVIIDPTKDFSNGQASFFPYATIVLQPANPSPNTSIGQYSNWLYELLLHEYTHILSFHNHRGIFTPLRWTLGSTVSPGYFLPVWYLEGLAVFTESYLTEGGRLRGSRYQSMQKLFSEESKKIHLSKINEQDLNWFPFGQNPYFFGSWLNQEMLNNVEGAKKIHNKFTGRVPFFVASGYKSATKKSVYKTWKKKFKKKKSSKNEDAVIGSQPLIHNNKIIFIGQDLYQTDEISEYDPKTKKTRVIAKTPRKIHQFKIVGSDIYFLSSKTRENEYRVNELFKAKLSKTDQSPKPITEKLRARNFDILNNKVIFSKIDINGDSIRLAALGTIDKHAEIYKAPAFARLSFVYFKDQNNILFAEKLPDLDEKIFIYNLNSKTKKEIFADEHIIYVQPANDSHYILSERKGEKFITSLKNNKKQKVNAGIFSFDLKGNQFWGEKLSLKGSQIKALNKKDITPLGKPDYLPQPIKPKVTQDLSNLKIKEKKYSSLNKLLPHYVMPNFTLSPYGFSGEFLYGLGVGSSDPLKFNQYSINVFTDSITEEVSGSFNYQSQHFRVPLFLSAGKFFEPLNLTDFRESSFARLLSQRKLSPNSAVGWSIGGGLLWDETRFNNLPEKRLGANFNISYTNTRLRPRELDPRFGYSFSLSSTHYTDINEEYTAYTNFTGSARKFFGVPFFKSHRLMLSVDASWNDELLLRTYAPISINAPNNGGFTLRGLPTGALLANELYAIGHLEYRFPLLRFDWGPGLWPVFLKRATGAIVSDFGVVNGTNRLTNAPDPSISTDEFLSSVGLEFSLETKVSYHVPVVFQLGVYNYLDQDFYSDGPEIFVGVNLSGLPF